MFLTPFSFCHFSLAVRSWTKKSVENYCSEFPASVFCSSFSIALLQRHRYYYSIALSPPTKCLPQNLPLFLCSALGKEMEEKKEWQKEQEAGREREREKPPTGMSDQSQLPAKATHSSGPDPVTPSRQMQALSHSPMRTHARTPITVSAHVYHIAAYIKANYVATNLHIRKADTGEVPGVKVEWVCWSVTPLCLCPSWPDLTLWPLKNNKGQAELWVTPAEERMSLEGERLELVCWPPAGW